MNRLRTLIRVDILIDQQWAVGAAPDLMFRPDDVDAADTERTTRLPVQRSATGEILLPATSLVGSLRRHLGADAARWLGRADGDDTIPSQLRTLTAHVHDSRTVELTTTAIDAHRRAASAGMLRREELASPGLVTWWLEWDHHDAGSDVTELAKFLATWHPVVGRRRSADRGRAHVQRVVHRTFDLNRPEDLTWWLRDRPRFDWRGTVCPTGWTELPGGSAHGGDPVMSVSLSVVDGLHLGGLPARENLRPTRPAVPSTSWRGIFRHRAEHILRVTGAPDADETIDRLFGAARKKQSEGGHRGQLRFGTSGVSGGTVIRDHVAIDRISGGAAQRSSDDILVTKNAGLLFSVECHRPGATLTLDIYDDSGAGLTERDTWLLHQIVRDIGDGIIGAGGMTGRGYGTLRTSRDDTLQRKADQ